MEGTMTTGLHFIPEPASGRPITIAHALELLRTEAGLSEPDTAKISIVRILPTSKPAWSFCLAVKKENDDTTHAVLLPACAKVRAIRTGFSAIETFDIQDLHQATVDSTGMAALRNGLEIRAIEAEAVALPYEFSVQDWRILIVLIEKIGGERSIYRSLRKSVPLEFRKGLPRRKWIDFTALRKRLRRPSVRIPGLKVIQYAYSQKFTNTQPPSIAKISDTIRRAGLREL
jgi:hypothetical protein